MRTRTGVKNHACVCAGIVRLTDDLRLKKKILLDRKLQADSKNGVQIEYQAKNDQVMGPQKGLIFEKTCFTLNWPVYSSGSRNGKKM